MEHISNAERWRRNVPCVDRPPLSVLLRLIGTVATVAAVLATVAAVAHAGVGQAGSSGPAGLPDLVVFTMPGCGPCESLQQAIQAGQFVGWRVVKAGRQSAAYEAFAAAIPTAHTDSPPDYVGPLSYRPAAGVRVPAIWIPGTSHYWTGYRQDQLDDLLLYLNHHRPQAPPQPPLDNPRPTRVTHPAPIPPRAIPEEFDGQGVHVVALVANLTDQLPTLRADLARRADQALSELARSKMGGKVQAHLVAEVSDPERFGAVSAACGLQPTAGGQPVACVVLIPERFQGLRGWLVGQAAAALAEHFLTSLQQAGISVIIERVHGGTYEATLQALAGPGGGSGDWPGVPGPADQFKFAVAAWLAERSDLARRLLSYLGFA